MDASTREIREAQWAQLILECNQSGETKRAFCERQGISEKTFYYRQRTIRLKLAAEGAGHKIAQVLPAEGAMATRFAEVSLHGRGAYQTERPVRILVSGLELSMEENVSEAFLVKLLRAARHAG
jgi:hypothetical protein